MDFQQLKQILEKYITGSTFALPAQSDLKSQAITDLIDQYLPASKTLTIAIQSQPPSNDQFIIDGTGVLFDGQPSAYVLQAVFEIVNQAPVMVIQAPLLAVSPAPLWSFGATFPALTGSVLDRFQFTAPLLILASTDNTSTGDPQIYLPGLNFNGTPLPQGPAKPVVPLFSDLTQIVIYGVITFTQNSPVMKLTSNAQNIDLSVIGVTLDLTFQLWARWIPSGTGQMYYPTAALISMVNLQNAMAFPISLQLFSAEDTLLLFDLVPGTFQVDAYSQLNQLSGGIDLGALVPSQLPLSQLHLTQLTVGINPSLPTLLASVDVGVGLEPTTPWTIIPSVLDVVGISMQFSITFGAAAEGSGPQVQITATIAGRFDIAKTFEYDVAIRVPELVLTGQLAPNSTIPLGQLFQHFIGKVDGIDKLEVYEFDFTADIRNQAYAFTAGVANVWTVPMPIIALTIQQVIADVNYSTNKFSMSLTAYWMLGPVPLMASAEKPTGDNGWNLAIGTQPNDTVDILGLTQNFLGANTQFPPFVPQTLTLTDVLFAGNTLTQNYTARATTSAGWELDLKTGAPNYSITASFDIESTATQGAPHRGFAVVRRDELGATRSYSGTISGELKIYSFTALVIYEFQPDNSTLTFQFSFRGVTLTCIWYRPQAGEDSVVTVNLGGVTFGGIVEFLVNLVDPNLGFKLESPWDILNQISFDNLLLTINLTKKTVGIAYKVDKDLVLFYLNTIGLTYQNKAAGGKTVVIDITGRFLDTTYDPSKPLSWDLLNDPPPAVPGKGSKLFELRYAGLGQNIGFRSVKSFANVAAVIKAMEEDFLPPTDPNQNPLTNNSALMFTGDGRWLIGADFTLLSTLTCAFVFNDPDLYGFRIAILQGGKIQALAGLEFELLYKKVTDTIGVYQIELKLPDSLRQIQLGAVSLTLPIIDIDIYTNGNFRVDMGFPVNMDFSRSFGVQVWPFIGYGGFYFALLNGQTSTKVPKISSGTFSPVIEAGIGLSIGVGKTIDKGVLKAGLSLTLEVVLEGVLAWYNPTNTADSHAMFYSVTGTAALVGKLYGVVDFVIIKASVSVVLYAQITINITAYQPILISATVGVEVQASVKILLFTVHFSFKTQVHASFTIGSASAPPWTVIPDSQQGSALRLRQQRTHYRHRAITAVQALRLLRERIGAATYDWTPKNVFNGAILPVPLTMAPSFTVALDGPLTVGARGATALPHVEAVMALFVGNSIQPQARTAQEVRMAVPGQAEEAPFTQIASGFLRWMIGSIDRTAPDFVTSVDLEMLSQSLADLQVRDQVFSYANVSRFFGLNYTLDISTPLHGGTGMTGATGMTGVFRPGAVAPNLYSDGPVGLAGRSAAAESAIAGAMGVTGTTGMTGATGSVTAFPMIPELIMTPQGMHSVNFKEKSPVDKEYEDKLSAYFNQLLVNSEQNVAQDPFAAPAAQETAVGATGTESMATFLFRDYFAMLSQSTLQSASDLLRQFPFPVNGNDSLKSIADQFPPVTASYQTSPGDTLDSISVAFGISVDTIRAANPWVTGYADSQPLPPLQTLVLNLGVTPEGIAAANQERLLNHKKTLRMSGVQYQVRSGDTLGAISRDFGSIPVGSLGAKNATNTSLLRATAKMTIPQAPYTVVAGDTLNLIAAVYVVRNQGVDSPYLGWYIQRIIELNPGIIKPVFPAGVTLTIPVAQMTAQGFQIDLTTVTYLTKSQDSVELIAAYFILLQLDPQQFAAFATAIQALNPGVPIQPGSTLQIPPFPRTVEPGDSFQSLADLFFQTPAGISAGNAATTGLLVPLTVLALPDFDYRIGAADTLTNIALLLDLSLDDLVKAIATQGGIFRPGDVVTVPGVPQLKVEQLLDEMAYHPSDAGGESSYHSVSAMVSRFLMGGMRVPKPEDKAWQELTVARLRSAEPVDVDLYGLYEVSGQQFQAPPLGTALYDITFTKGPTAGWVQFVSPQGPVTELALKLTAADLKENYPSTVFDPGIVSGPERLPLMQETPVRYGLQQSLHWQSSVPPELPLGPTGSTGMTGATGMTGQVSQGAGEPSIWLFPDTLLARVAGGQTGATPPFELQQIMEGPDGAARQQTLSTYAWAAAVPVQVQQLKAASGDPMANGYLMLGADQTGSQVLLDAWSYLERTGNTDNARLYLLYTPNVTNGNGKGLASDQLDASNTYLLKTNLSTVTHGGPQGLATAGEAGQYFSTISSAGAFLKYLWECSIVGTGGFYLNYVNAGGNLGLPPDIFTSGGSSAQVWLMILLDSQTRPYGADRGLYTFNNCAVLGSNLDASSSTLFVQPQNPGPSDLTRTSTVPQGVAGFLLTRTNPGSTGVTGPEYRTQSLYSLLGFQLAGNDYFTASNEGLPVMPAKNDASDFAGLAAPRFVNLDDDLWSYHQAVPVAQFGKINSIPPCVALPGSTANPYAGITGPAGPTGATGPFSQVTFDLAFHDTFGNQTVSTEPLQPLSFAVGYLDPVIGLASWPGAGSQYLFVSANGPQLSALVTLQLSKYLPGGQVDFSSAVYSASTDLQRYKQIYYQLGQPDVSLALRTSLDQVSPSQPPAPYPLAKQPFVNFVSSAYAFLNTAQNLKPAVYTTPASTPAPTLSALSDLLSVNIDTLGQANQDVRAASLFQTEVAIPHFHVMGAMDSMASIVSGVTGLSGNPVCPIQLVKSSDGPVSPATLGARMHPSLTAGPTALSLTVVELAENNQNTALTPSLDLLTTSRSYVVPANIDPADNMLDVIAASQNATVLSAFGPLDPVTHKPSAYVGLVEANFGATGIIAPNLWIQVDQQGTATTQTSTFENLFGYFQPFGVELSEFAEAVKGVTGVFVPGTTIQVADYLTKVGDTLASLPAALGGVDTLANLNQDEPGIFQTGSALYLTYSCYAPSAQETLASIAEDSQISVAQLVETNADAPLASGEKLQVPGLVEIDTSQPYYSPYVTAGSQSFADVAALFGQSMEAFAELNRFLNGLFVPGQPIIINSIQIPTTAASTFDNLYAAFLKQIPTLTFQQFADAVGQVPKLVAAGVVVFGTLPTVPTAAGVSLPLLTIAQNFNLQPTTLASPASAISLVEANCSLRGFLRDGASLSVQTGALTVKAFDTFQTMVARFKQELGIVTSVDELALANQTQAGLLTAGSTFLLPPNPISVQVAITPHIPETIFPVTVDVEVNRNPNLVDPEFAGVEAIVTTSSALAPLAEPGADGSTLQLTSFAEKFEQAFGTQKLKAATGRTGNVAESISDTRQIWAVNFGASGISQFEIQANKPAFYALRPLSTQLISRSVPVRDYVSGQGLSPQYKTKSFQSIDMDGWMQDFLSAVELVLTPDYALSGFPLTGGVGPTGPTGPTGPVAAPTLPIQFQPWEGPAGLAFSTPELIVASTSLGVTGATGSGGRAAFENIVSAKDTLAGALQRNVTNILFPPLPPANPYLQDAQENLKEQMLVNLTSAYSVNAIVQYPVVVTANLPAGIPPRLSGKLIPAVYTTSAVTTLRQLTQPYPVDVSYLASVLVGVQFIVNPGVAVSYNGQSVTTKSSDTLASIATALGVNPDPSSAGFWEAWSQFIAGAAGIQDVGIIAARVAIPLTQIRRGITTIDTVGSLADYMAVAVPSFAEANLNVPGIFIQGQPIVIGGQTVYHVGPNDTLANILAQIQKTLPQLTLEQLSIDLEDVQGLVNPLTTVFGVQLMPDVTLSTAKVSTGPLDGTHPDPPLTFLVNVRQQAQYSKVFLNLQYVINQLEFDIRDVAGVDGYQASSWLSFILPIQQNTIGQVEIPLPLRSYPTPPSMLAQAGSASDPAAVTIPAARLWDYSFTYESQNAAQDTSYLEVTFNRTDSSGLAANAGGPDLFAALAQFANVYAPLKNDLALLPKLTPGAQNQTAAVAFQTFADLCLLVSGSMGRTRNVLARQAGPTQELYEFRLDTRNDPAGNLLDTLTVTLENYQGPVGLRGSTGLTGGAWPNIFVETSSGVTGMTGLTGPVDQFEPLTLLKSTDTWAVYRYPSGIPAFAPLTSKFAFPARDVIRNQNASSGVFLTRNQDLVSSGPLGATGVTGVTGSLGPIPTNPQFVYQTPIVRFASPLQPLLVNQSIIPVDRIQGTDNTLAGYLTRMFTQLLELDSLPSGTTFTIQVACSYAFTLGASGSTVTANTPILLVPQFAYNTFTGPAFVTELAGQIQTWTRDNQPNPTGGSYMFDVGVFAQAGATGMTGPVQQQPMLELERLQLGMTAIQPSTLGGPPASSPKPTATQGPSSPSMESQRKR